MANRRPENVHIQPCHNPWALSMSFGGVRTALNAAHRSLFWWLQKCLCPELRRRHEKSELRNACIAGFALMDPLFAPFRALGYITDDVPFAVQRRGRESFVTVSVGSTWQASTWG